MEKFYQNLPTISGSIKELFAKSGSFRSLPSSWHVVVTDIKNSTAAIAEGRHQDINLMATASIVAALNVANRHKIDIPFFFGGDGATMLVPDQILTDVLENLQLHTENAKTQFDLELRLGSKSMEQLLDLNRNIKIAKINITHFLTIPVVIGDGLYWAEQEIKSQPQNIAGAINEQKQLDLTGMECRWDRIKPPGGNNRVLSLLINAIDANAQTYIFKEALRQIELHYGSITKRNPITTERLRIQASYLKIKTEMRARIGRYSLPYLLKNWTTTLLGKAYFSGKNNRDTYLQNLVLLSDTLVIDGRINTVISGTTEQRERLIAGLNKMEQADKIRFGWHESPASIMSCYVRNRIDQHIHFVDGSEGGYTKAATMLKKKLQQV